MVVCIAEVVKCVDDVLAGRGAGFGRFVGVKGVDDVLAGVEQGAYGGVYGDGAVDGVCAFFALLQVVWS